MCLKPFMSDWRGLEERSYDNEEAGTEDDGKCFLSGTKEYNKLQSKIDDTYTMKD